MPWDLLQPILEVSQDCQDHQVAMWNNHFVDISLPTPVDAIAPSQVLKLSIFFVSLIQMSPAAIPTCLVLLSISFWFYAPLVLTPSELYFTQSSHPWVSCPLPLHSFYTDPNKHWSLPGCSLQFRLHFSAPRLPTVPQKPETEPSQKSPFPLPPHHPRSISPPLPTPEKRTRIQPHLAIWESVKQQIFQMPPLK